MQNPTRRRLLSLLGPAVLAGCAAPLSPPTVASSTPAALALLREAGEAHGQDGFARLHDVAVGYAGQWRPLVASLQPVLVDRGFRGGSQERLLLADNLVGQSHTGPDGHKQVVRAPGTIRVWFNGTEATDRDRLDAAALVADGYALFLLGPLLLARRSGLVLQRGPAETIDTADGPVACEVLRGRLVPGIGRSEADDIAVYLGQADRLMRRIVFTLNGLDSTRGAVAQVDTLGHCRVGGVAWPTRFHERLLRPVPLAVHDWSLTGLDLDRGITRAMIDGPEFGGLAVGQAQPLD